MMAVEVHRQLLPNRLVRLRGVFKQQLLHVARQVGPDPQRRRSKDLFKSRRISHFHLQNSYIDAGRRSAPLHAPTRFPSQNNEPPWWGRPAITVLGFFFRALLNGVGHLSHRHQGARNLVQKLVGVLLFRQRL